jgi:Protein of unknown function (DUF642)
MKPLPALLLLLTVACSTAPNAPTAPSGTMVSSNDVLAVKPSGEPVVLLSDNFDTENGAAWIYSYTGFANWEVVGGAVDLIGGTIPNDFYVSWGEGMFVDLDGSGIPGLLQTRQTFTFKPNRTYVVEFWLSGSRSPAVPNNVNTVTIKLDNQTVATLTLPYMNPWQAYSYQMEFEKNTRGKLSFQNDGTDWSGALLDKVKLTEMPK